MTLASTRDLIDQAVYSRSALPSLNVIGLEHAEGIVRGAERANSSVLLQVSENAILFRGGSPRPLLAACREIALAAAVPVAIHLDHITQPRLLQESIDLAAELGVSSIMVDASVLDYEDNVRTTRDFAERAHIAGLWVEAELGAIGGKGGAHRPGIRTDPTQADDFVSATGIDGLAVAVGSSHRMMTQTAELDNDLIQQIAHAVSVPLVLHGSSGVSDEGLRSAVIAGIRKVNVGTALNQAALRSLTARDTFDPNQSDPRPYLAVARDAIASAAERICSVLIDPSRPRRL